MSGFELRDPLFLLAGLLAPLAYWIALRGAGRLTYSSLELVEATSRSLRARLARLPALLLAMAIVLFAVALAGPRSGDATTEIYREGIAIALVVDHSGSMEARDFVQGNTGVSRLDAVKEVVRSFVLGEGSLAGRRDDLVGVVAFARYADAVSPLTLDHLNLANILDQIEIVRERSEDGTAVGEGLALAVERLRRHPAKSKVAILLTDGVNNAGEIDPLQAASLAAAHDIRVYAVGAGRTGTAPMPVELPDGRRVLRRVQVELDEKTLQKIASRTGGRYFHAANADALEEVYEEIDRLERSEITELRYLQYTEHYGAWVGAGLVSVAISALLGGTLLRRFP